MTTHQFTLVVNPAPVPRRCRNALARLDGLTPDVTAPPHLARILVVRDAPTLAEAVTTAIHDIESTGLTPMRIHTDDCCTLENLGQRIERSREIVRLWSLGRQGPGGFPPPINPGRDTLFFSWAEVAPWLRRMMKYNVPAEEPLLHAMSLALQIRHLIPHLTDPQPIYNLLGPPTPTRQRRTRKQPTVPFRTTT